MDNITIMIGMFIFSLFIDFIMFFVLYTLSKDITDLHNFIMEFLDTMIGFENEKLEIIKRREDEEVVQGKWKLNNLNGFKIYDCSNCGIHMETKWNYCPHCGAKMDERREDD